jgi:hypothetical protein
MGRNRSDGTELRNAWANHFSDCDGFWGGCASRVSPAGLVPVGYGLRTTIGADQTPAPPGQARRARGGKGDVVVGKRLVHGDKPWLFYTSREDITPVDGRFRRRRY